MFQSWANKAKKKPETTFSTTKAVKEDKRWGTFHKKAGVTVAPMCRVSDPAAGAAMLDRALDVVDVDPAGSDINELQGEHRARCRLAPLGHRLSSVIGSRSGGKLPAVHIADATATLDQDDSGMAVDTDKPTYRRRLSMKLLMFHTDVRPPYYGTFSKRSSMVTARRPHGKDPYFDYEYDSEAEWEPEDAETGDECDSADEDEEDTAVQGAAGGEEVDEEGWMVPHGYLSDDEGAGNDSGAEDGDDESKVARKRARKSTSEEESPRKQRAVEKPYSIGCIWGTDAMKHSKLGAFKMVALVATPIDVNWTKPIVIKPVKVRVSLKMRSANPYEGASLSLPHLPCQKKRCCSIISMLE